MVNGVVYAGFGGHCDYFNYTGMVIGINTAQKKVVAAFAMESGPAVRHDTWNVAGGGGEAGIWQSGMGLATDGNRLFFVTVRRNLARLRHCILAKKSPDNETGQW